MRWLDSITDSVDINLDNLQIVKDREAWYAASMGAQRVGHDLVTEQQEVEEAEREEEERRERWVRRRRKKEENNIGLSTGKSRSSIEISIW